MVGNTPTGWGAAEAQAGSLTTCHREPTFSKLANFCLYFPPSLGGQKRGDDCIFHLRDGAVRAAVC